MLDVAAVVTHRVVVGPVDQSAEVVPLKDTPQGYAIAKTDRNTICQTEIVRYEQCLPAAHIDDKALVSSVLVVIRQQSNDDTVDGLPCTGVTLLRPGSVRRCATTTHA